MGLAETHSDDELPLWDVVTEMPRATALLHPLRLRILELLDEPDSASGLARRLYLPAQKVNYHVRKLARARFLVRVGRVRHRSKVERRYKKTAAGYILSPELLGQMGFPRSADLKHGFLDANHFFNLITIAQSELGRWSREAAVEGTVPATLALTAEFGFETALLRGQFAEEVRQAISEVIERHSNAALAASRGGEIPRKFRLILGCYPVPDAPALARAR